MVAGTDSVGEGVGFFLAAGFDPFAFGHALLPQKLQNRKGKTLCRWILFRKQVFLREFRLSKNSHLGQIAIGFLSGHHRSVFQKTHKAVTSAKAWT